MNPDQNQNNSTPLPSNYQTQQPQPEQPTRRSGLRMVLIVVAVFFIGLILSVLAYSLFQGRQTRNETEGAKIYTEQALPTPTTTIQDGQSEYERLTKYIKGFELLPESAREPVYEKYKETLAFCAGVNSPGVTVLKVVREDFIHLGVGCRGGGNEVFARYNNVWQKVWGGQDIIGCDVVEKYKISKEIMKECYGSQLQKTREVSYP